MFDPSRVRVGLPDARTIADLFRLVGGLLATGGKDTEPGEEGIAEALAARERVATTAVGNGVALPHARLAGVVRARAALVTLPGPGLDLSAPDGEPVRIVAALVLPENAPAAQLKALAALSKRLRDPDVRAAVLAATTPDEAIRAVDGGET